MNYEVRRAWMRVEPTRWQSCMAREPVRARCYGRPFSGYSFGAVAKRVPRPWVREPTTTEVMSYDEGDKNKNVDIGMPTYKNITPTKKPRCHQRGFSTFCYKQKSNITSCRPFHPYHPYHHRHQLEQLPEEVLQPYIRL